MPQLIDIAAQPSRLDPDDTIYAAEPWTAGSQVIVAPENQARDLPVAVVEAGMTYFLEVTIAQDFVEDYLKSATGTPNSHDIFNRLIAFAIDDA